MTDILIAEDSLTARTLLKHILKKMNFNIAESVDGEDAWDKLNKENPPRIALIDWMMPKLDGISLIKRIREAEKKTNTYTYLIMVTSNTEQEEIDLGFDAGADDYIAKPIDPQALGVRLKIASRIIKQQQELTSQLMTQKEDILKAQEIQQILNTAIIPQLSNINIQAVYNPSQDMGGDFFNIIKTSSRNIATIMVDCTGHGLEASMYATLLKSVCDRHTAFLDNPRYITSFVQMVNIDIASYINSDQYPVMFVSIYNPLTKKFYYCSANGEHPYLIRQGRVIKLAKAIGMHLGYNTESQYEGKSFYIEPEDIILFYSDAIIEIEGASWDRQDDTDLKNELSKMGRGLQYDNKEFMKFISSTAGSTVLEDDLSLIYFQFKDPIQRSLDITMEEELTNLTTKINKELKLFDYSEDQIERMTIVIRELVLNAIEHGNKNANYKNVKIEYDITCNIFNIRIEDEGEGFDETLIPDPTDEIRLKKLLDDGNEKEYTRGRGIWMAKNFMDEVVYSDEGRIVIATKTKDRVKTLYNYKI